MTGAVEVEIAGERLVLMPERCVFWKRRSTLLLADTHWGKAAAFRSAGLPVPGGTTAAGLERLDRALAATQARRVLVLGDLLHSREGRAPGTMSVLNRWRRSHPGLELVLVRGNHDRHAGDPPPELDIDCVDGPLQEGPFSLVHEPRSCPDGYALAGHIHPVVRLVGRGRLRERPACFWIRDSFAVLPAFGDFTGGGEVQPLPGDRVYVIAGDVVVGPMSSAAPSL
jgi:uncharacterized protein